MNKLFRGGDWHVCFRERQNENCIFEPDSPFVVVPNPSDGWIADPFLVQMGGRLFLFAEYFIFSKEKGTIGVSEYMDGDFSPIRIVIEEAFHLSYPVVFSYDDSFYMIPESGQGGRIGLYRSKNFPYEWEFVVELVGDGNYADTTLTKNEDGVIELVSYQKERNRFKIHLIEFSLVDMDTISHTSFFYDENYCRPGGLPLTIDGELLIPVQDCREKYGNSLGFFAFDHTAEYATRGPLYVLDINSISLESKITVQRIHTFNSAGRFEVIDVFEEHFDLLHAPKMLRRRIRTALFRLRGRSR